MIIPIFTFIRIYLQLNIILQFEFGTDKPGLLNPDPEKKLELLSYERCRLFNRVEDCFNISFTFPEEKAIKTPYDLINAIMEKRMRNGSELINHFLFSGRNTSFLTSDHSHFM
ncbi:hypothetical protein [Pedobacter steynii]|uniref:Uncharacterized protein n=1 Tax=Pedobacter steynii TaxID=430522 RepID=A0A1D7QK02_9SPHI|nr:hypothetical protein [Pedobacter steynii]AOM78995.1 hypothetical protein BFS30_18565 [Pedobacter steynii]